MLSILFTDRVDLEVANRLNVHHSLYLPPIRQVQLFFPPAEPRSDHNSTDLPVYELKLQHLSCFYCGKELGTLLLWTGFSFRFDTQPNEEKKRKLASQDLQAIADRFTQAQTAGLGCPPFVLSFINRLLVHPGD